MSSGNKYLKNTSNFKLIRPSEENTIHRHLLVWADHASVLNTGHLLFTIRVIFTPKVFYTDSEMLASTGIVHGVQEIVETPAIYILGQTTDFLSEKLSYTETRLEDIKNLTPLMIDGNTVTDEMRFFLGKFKQKLYILGEETFVVLPIIPMFC